MRAGNEPTSQDADKELEARSHEFVTKEAISMHCILSTSNVSDVTKSAVDFVLQKKKQKKQACANPIRTGNNPPTLLLLLLSPPSSVYLPPSGAPYPVRPSQSWRVEDWLAFPFSLTRHHSCSALIDSALRASRL